MISVNYRPGDWHAENTCKIGTYLGRLHRKANRQSEMQFLGLNESNQLNVTFVKKLRLIIQNHRLIP